MLQYGQGDMEVQAKDRAAELRGIAERMGFDAPDSIIHLFVGGSEAHGAKIGDKEDLDIYGIYVPPPERALGITEYEPMENGQQRAKQYEHFVRSTAPATRRNGPDDTDLKLYSLRKWAGMAVSGNPDAMHFLFTPNLAPSPSVWEKYIRPNCDAFVCSHAGYHYGEFAKHMLRTLKGEGTGKRGQRDDLIGEFGYDTKAAMHLIRVLGEGIELMMTGAITLPRPEKNFLIAIRSGKYGTLKDIEILAKGNFNILEQSRSESALPEYADRARVSGLVAEAYLEHWAERVLCGTDVTSPSTA